MTSPWKTGDDAVRVNASSCPSCGQVVDGATVVGERSAVPRPGDLAVCIYCAAVNAYALGRDGLVLEAVTGDDLILALADPNVKAAVAAVRAYRHAKQ